MEPLPRKQAPPKALGLNKKTLIICFIVIAVMLSVSIIHAVIAPKKEQKSKGKSAKPHRVGMLNDLPETYADIKRTKAMLKPTVKPVVLKDDALLKRQLKKALEAKEAGAEFTSVRLPKTAPKPKTTRDEKTYPHALDSKLFKITSEKTLLAGSIIPGLLLTGINSDLAGSITGQVSKNVFDSLTGRHLLIPMGSKVIGSYESHIVYGQERVLVRWNRIILLDGKSLAIKDMAGVDTEGYAGLKDKVNNHYGKLFTGVVLGSVLGAGAQMAQGRSNQRNPSYEQLATQGAARDVSRVTGRITDRALNIEPTIEIRAGMRFNIFVEKDLVFE